MPITGAIETTGVAMEKTADSHLEDVDKELLRGVAIDPVAEKKLVRKCDIRVVPILFVLFLAAFLDRINIGRSSVLL